MVVLVAAAVVVEVVFVPAEARLAVEAGLVAAKQLYAEIVAVAVVEAGP